MKRASSVDEYLSWVPDDHRPLLDSLRQAIRDIAPAATEAALGDELKPYFSGKGTVRFAADRPVPVDLVKRIVRVRLDEVGAG